MTGSGVGIQKIVESVSFQVRRVPYLTSSLFMANSDWERILIFSDTHSIFLDKKAWRCFLQVCADYKPDRVIGNGDILDCTGISEHASKVEMYFPEHMEDYSFAYELDFTYEEILKPLRKAIGKAKLQLRLGNHEMRFLRPNRANAKALAEIHEVCVTRKATQLEDLMKLDKVGATLSYNSVDVLYGTFTLIHGVKTGAGAAKANLLRYGSGCAGHDHRANCWTQILQGKLQGWWTSGCLRKCENVEYLPHGDKPDWANAFLSLVINKKTGKYFCKCHFIIDGVCEFNGKLYS